MSKFDYRPAFSIPIITPDDPETASYETNIDGWVSRNGNFFGKDEELARWDGSTHVKCRDCGEAIPKGGHLLCSNCRAEKRHERYLLKPTTMLRPDEMLYSEGAEVFFQTIKEAQKYAYEWNLELEQLDLVTVDPIYPREIHIDYWYDQLPNDGDELPEELLDAIDDFNKKISNMPPLSYKPGKYRIDIGTSGSGETK
jgi:hypothetical protein